MRNVHFARSSFINCVQALTVYALLLPELFTQLLLLSTTIMKSKRILSSVSLVFVLATTVFLGSFSSIQAQSYKKGVELNDTLVQYTQKKSFKYAGDKLMIYEALQDTSKKTQLITIKLLNPDFTTFKTFSRELPIDKYVMFFHNGVDVIEQMEGDKPAYYWRYTTDMYDEINGRFHNYTTVLNENSDSLFSFEVDFHGARTFENSNSIKIVGESFFTERIYEPGGSEYDYYDMDVWTSYIYDVKTGFKEFTFPTGTQFKDIAIVNDSAFIITQNNNMEMFRNAYHPNGSEATCMKMRVYNMDYSVNRELDYSFSSLGFDKDDINYVTLYDLLSDGHNLYFLHSFDLYIKDEQGGVLGYTDHYVLTDKNGVFVKRLDNPTQVPYSALWLPSRNGTFFTNYNGVLFSCPQADSLTRFDTYTIKEDSSVVFANIQEDSIRLFNERFEQFNAIESFPGISDEWSLSDFSQKNVSDDDLLELVFRNNNNGVKVLNENGKVLVNEPDSAWKISFMENAPIFLKEDGHKYANLVDENLGLWYRTAPLKAEVRQDNMLLPLSLQVYREVDDSVFMVDSVKETGMYEGFLPEGTYFVRTVSDSLPSTYYPSALLWEDATPIEFTTDSLDVLTINQPSKPEPLSPTNEGSISGTLTSAIPALLWAIDPKDVRVYVVPSGSRNVIAMDSLDDMTFEMNHLPYGTYELYVDIPGKEHLTTTTCLLTSEQKQCEVGFTVSNNGISGTVITGLTKQSRNNSFAVVPNPASERIQFNAAFEGCMIELFDMAGRNVLSTSIQGGEVRINQLPEGMYMVRVQSKEGVLRSTLLKK